MASKKEYWDVSEIIGVFYFILRMYFVVEFYPSCNFSWLVKNKNCLFC